jgi:arylsulfatase A-like enzyme
VDGKLVRKVLITVYQDFELPCSIEVNSVRGFGRGVPLGRAIVMLALCLGVSTGALGNIHVGFCTRELPHRQVRSPEPKKRSPIAGHPPNVVLIVADDLGFNDLTFNGGGVASGNVPTPSVDSIAKDGVIFTQAYAGSAMCAPSRATLMTGRYATRFGYEFTPTHPIVQKLIGTFQAPQAFYKPMYFGDRLKDMPPLEQIGMPSSEITIAEMLKERGYFTTMIGKWHLGEQPGMRPNEQGFDESLAFLIGASMYKSKTDSDVVNSIQEFDPVDKLLWEAHPFAVSHNNGPRFKPPKYITDYFGDEAVSTIGQNKNRPFFLYLAFNAPHTPLQALRSDYDALTDIQDHRLRVYAAMIRSLDRNVGKVLEALKVNGLEDNTLVIFTSDNGGAHYIGLPNINKPFRGWKSTFFEGGIRVPYLIKWPSLLSRSAVYPKQVSHVDLFSTMLAAAGGAPPVGRVLDGVNLLPFLNGVATRDPHKTLFWRTGDYKVLLTGNWKLQISSVPNRTWLFNLKEDPTESVSLVLTLPSKVTQLKKILQAIDLRQAKPLWPALSKEPIAIDHPGSFMNKESDEVIYWSN